MAVTVKASSQFPSPHAAQRKVPWPRAPLYLLSDSGTYFVTAWFERTARPAQVKVIYGFKIDRLSIYDDDAVVPEW
jgi:hypothetical protein